MERRQVLGWFVKGVGLTVGGVIAVPAVITAVSPVLRTPRPEYWAPVGPVEEFQPGEVAKRNIEAPRHHRGDPPMVKAVFILRRGDDEFTVFSRTCTDLSCPLTFDEGSRWFYCPCHGGIFDMEGVPQAGPPNRPMYRYATRITGGVLEIDLNSVPIIA
jgi:menaquinol-cytochrome c reductase iron-sulfur subunit